MGIAQDRKVEEVLHCLPGALGVHLACQGVPPKHLQDFQVKQVGCSDGFGRAKQTFGDLLTG